MWMEINNSILFVSCIELNSAGTGSDYLTPVTPDYQPGLFIVSERVCVCV